jgi:hypothetical protein
VIYFCCDEGRRNAVRDLPTDAYNGIDFLEVLDRAAPFPPDRQKILQIHFIRQPANPGELANLIANITAITVDNVVIEGGVRVTGVEAVATALENLDGERILRVTVNEPGDFSTYRLRLVDRDGAALAWLDPRLSEIEFAFKIECLDDVDCKSSNPCPPEPREQPDIDYLAKDYGSFRQLMLDRLSLLLPTWRAETPADTGIMLVELLAYVGDYLSYQQDAVATEAYLGTAKRRSSVRRHARLVDYDMHDGCNSRVWVHLEVAPGTNGVDFPGAVAGVPELPLALTEIVGLPVTPTSAADIKRQAEEIRAGRTECFEPMHSIKLYAAHNQIDFHTWGDEECVLPKGATKATLQDPGKTLQLKRGDALVFEEIIGALSGDPDDADPRHRHVVKLTKVTGAVDMLAGRFKTPPDNTTLDVVEIEWGQEDALPFPLCLSSITEQADGSDEVPIVSVARGNLVLFDHGRTIPGEKLGQVINGVKRTVVPASDPRLAAPPLATGERCGPREMAAVPPRFQPSLDSGPLTQVAPTPDAESSASAAFVWTMEQVLPAITLTEVAGDERSIWRPQRDLLASNAFALEFVAEVEASGVASIRFGDDVNGARPSPGTELVAKYRVGNGVRGNVGAESIFHLITVVSQVVAVRNPMVARRGVEPETIEHVRQTAPAAFRKQERAVTPADYAETAQRHADVQRAVATLRWTGSWRTVYLTVDRLGGRPVDAEFVDEMRDHMERYRMAGHDLEIQGPRYVPLEVTLRVCVLPSYFRSDVKGALLEVFSSVQARDGKRGVFHPDNFTFAQPVYLSKIYAAAHAVPGVSSVRVEKFQRLGIDDPVPLELGILDVGRLEIAQLDNDPNFPERGNLLLIMEGGR